MRVWVCVPELSLVSQKHPCDSCNLILILFSLRGPHMHFYEVILPTSRGFSSTVPQLTPLSLLFVPRKNHSHLICSPLCLLFLLHSVSSVDALTIFKISKVLASLPYFPLKICKAHFAIVWLAYPYKLVYFGWMLFLLWITSNPFYTKTLYT